MSKNSGSNPSFDKESYLSQFEAARRRVVSTKVNVLDWVTKLDEHAASEYILIEELLDQFPRQHRGEAYRIVHQIHETPKRVGSLGVAVRSESTRRDFWGLELTELRGVLRPHVAPEKIAEYARAIRRFNLFNQRIVALSSFEVQFSPVDKRGPLLPRWFDSLEAFGAQCQPKIEAAFNNYIALSDDLDDAIFEFNGAMPPIRYRSIRCSYTLDDFDPLGPSNPHLKVVTSRNRETMKRHYTSMYDFKRGLKRKRIAQELRRELGRPADRGEIDAAIEALRVRRESVWITKDVIKACYLGRSITEVMSLQKKLADVMQPWSLARAQLQALLP